MEVSTEVAKLVKFPFLKQLNLTHLKSTFWQIVVSYIRHIIILAVCDRIAGLADNSTRYAVTPLLSMVHLPLRGHFSFSRGCSLKESSTVLLHGRSQSP